MVVALASMQMLLTLLSLARWALAVAWPALRSIFIRSRHRRGRLPALPPQPFRLLCAGLL
jgi:hypothetical protein